MKPDRIIHSKRKSFAIVIERDGTLVVRAPLHASTRQIETLLDQKQDWILEKQAAVRAHPAKTKTQAFKEGESFLYLGNEYPLKIVERQRQALELNGCFSLRRDRLEDAREVFAAWYRAEARRVISARLESYAGQYGFKYKSMRISSARTRWGSCGRDTLNFSWRLVMAPLEALDYVVVHELCHLRQHNHSPAFWQEVERIQPDYKQRSAWLKQNGYRLTLL